MRDENESAGEYYFYVAFHGGAGREEVGAPCGTADTAVVMLAVTAGAHLDPGLTHTHTHRVSQ